MKTLYLLGGRPCSGKSTFSLKLHEKTKYKYVNLDAFIDQLVEESTSLKPELYKWKTLDMIEILQDEPEILFQDYIKLYDESLNDVLTLINDDKHEHIILEGSFLLPKYISAFQKISKVIIVYIQTSDSFVNLSYPTRGYVQSMLKTAKGEIALNHLLERDRIFSSYITEQANINHFKIIEIKDQNDFDNAYQKLLNTFSL